MSELSDDERVACQELQPAFDSLTWNFFHLIKY